MAHEPHLHYRNGMQVLQTSHASVTETPCLHQVAGQLAQFATLAFHQIDVGKKILVAHTVDHINQTIGLAVQIRLVDLLNIARKHHFGSFCPHG